MNLLIVLVGVALVVLSLGILLYVLTPRRYQSSESVADSYDQWTEDGISEFVWESLCRKGLCPSFPCLAVYKRFFPKMIILELLKVILELLELLGKCVFITIGIMAIYACLVNYLDKRKK